MNKINLNQMSHKFFIAIAIISFLPGSFLNGQSQLPTERIEVVKDFDARLIDVRKLKIQPKLPMIDTAMRKYQYLVNVQNFDLEYEAPILRPIAMNREKTPATYQHYLKGGYGTMNTIYGDLGVNIIEDGLYDVGLNYRHLSANNSKNLQDQRFLETGGKIKGQYYLTDFLSAGGHVDYGIKDYGLYGYDHSVVLGPDLKNQKVRYNTLNVGTKIYNPTRTEQGFDYSVDISLIKHQDNLGHTEKGTKFNLFGAKMINQKHALQLKVDGDLSKFTGSESEQSINNFSATPSFTYNKENYKVKLGGQVSTSKDEFFFFPDVEITLNLVGNTIMPYAGWNGDLQKNSFQSITEYNPFASIEPVEINNSSWNKYYGGFRGAYKTVRYQFEGSYKTIKNMAVFEQNIVDERKFDVSFDDGNIISIGGSIDADVIKGGKVGLSITKQFINLDNFEEPWHIPGFEWSSFASYKIFQDRLHLTATLDAQSGAPYRDLLTNQKDRLDGLLDVSFKGTYYILENAGIFLHLNNLTNNKRERWQQYPNFGFNAVGGVSLRF